MIGTIALVAVGLRREAEPQRDVARSGQLAANAGDALAVDPALGASPNAVTSTARSPGSIPSSPPSSARFTIGG